MQRIGLISDTHIPSRGKSLPPSIFKVFNSVDLILHAGDLEVLSVTKELEKLAPVKAVHGNMCRYEVKKTLPNKRIIKVEDVHIGLFHGNGGLDGYYERILNEFKSELDKIDIIVCGHTHLPEAKLFNNIQFINPGSAVDKYFAPKNTVAILNIDNNKFTFKYFEL
ncbi:MAG: metallophosphoesterase family protein [Candidatus Hodarchaeales archaeon]